MRGFSLRILYIVEPNKKYSNIFSDFEHFIRVYSVKNTV